MIDLSADCTTGSDWDASRAAVAPRVTLSRIDSLPSAPHTSAQASGAVEQRLNSALPNSRPDLLSAAIELIVRYRGNATSRARRIRNACFR
jgi:Cdc6-like AAA superfamily ATPase